MTATRGYRPQHFNKRKFRNPGFQCHIKDLKTSKDPGCFFNTPNCKRYAEFHGFSAICCLLNSHYATTVMPGDEGHESHEGTGEIRGDAAFTDFRCALTFSFGLWESTVLFWGIHRQTPRFSAALSHIMVPATCLRCELHWVCRR